MSGQSSATVAVVTGGSSGIGRSIARSLRDEGATVVSLDLQPGPDGDIDTLIADVSSEQAVTAAFDSVLSDHDRIDVLVNNAGLFSHLQRVPFWQLPTEEWERVLRVNVTSAFLCARAASGAMRAHRSGRIVNIASNSVTFGMGELLHYVTSKAAIIGMTRSLARELGPFGITVNAVAPGLVTTEVTAETVPSGHRRTVMNSQVIEREVSGSDVAAAVHYLCSPAAALVTGQTLLVNGGATMSAV